MLHLKMIFRSWWRSGMSTVISFVSLTIGLIGSILLILFVLSEYRIADAMGDTDQVYMLESKAVRYDADNVVESSVTPTYATMLRDRYGEVEDAAIVHYRDLSFDKSVESSDPGKFKIYQVYPEMAQIFDIPVREGDLSRTLSSASEVAVTDQFMLHNFGRKAVLGDVITGKLANKSWINGVQEPDLLYNLTITTILEETDKLPLKYDGMMLLPRNNVESLKGYFVGEYLSFVKLTPPNDIESLKAKLATDSAFIRNDERLLFTPFSRVYLDDQLRAGRDGEFVKKRDPALLTIALTIAFAILIIASFNYINITMTRARGRLRNIAGQRIFGASKWAVRWQTVLDTALLTLISLGIALLVINAVLSQFNSFMGCEIHLGEIFEPTNFLTIIALVALLIFLPSSYILLKIEVNSPMETLKNPLGRNARISSVMVIAQFVISVVLITVGINISRQMNFIASQRTSAESIIEIQAGGYRQILPRDFADRITSMAWVESFTPEMPAINGSISMNNVNANYMRSTVGMFDFFDLQLIEGRLLTDTDVDSKNTIVNEAFVRMMKLENPIGKELHFNRESIIVGVVKDFIYEDAHQNIQPIIMESVDPARYKSGYRGIYVKTKANTDRSIDEIKAIWREMYPTQSEVQTKTVAQIYREMHPQDMRLLTMVNIFMYLSIALTSLGLFGLAFYSVGRRTKEIALRKIHGSTTMQVIVLLGRTFALWVGASFVIAVPIAYYLSREWLSTFIYRVPIVLWVFIATAGIAALVTFVTVIYQTWSAARANPAHNIKIE